jgi:periplasmic protein TonB
MARSGAAVIAKSMASSSFSLDGKVSAFFAPLLVARRLSATRPMHQRVAAATIVSVMMHIALAAVLVMIASPWRASGNLGESALSHAKPMTVALVNAVQSSTVRDITPPRSAVSSTTAGAPSAGSTSGMLNVNTITPESRSDKSSQTAPANPKELLVPMPTASGKDAPASPGSPFPPLPPAPSYFVTSKLQIAPRPLTDVEPEFPDRVGKQNGVVTLRILINESGRVDDVAVVAASPIGVFEKSALAAWSQAKFAPGRIAGNAVKSQMTIEVVFEWVPKQLADLTLPTVASEVH